MSKSYEYYREFQETFLPFLSQLFEGDERLVIVNSFIAVLAQEEKTLEAKSEEYHLEIEDALHSLSTYIDWYSDDDANFLKENDIAKSELATMMTRMITNLTYFE